MRVWIYLNGAKTPTRGFADANCDVFIGDFIRIFDGKRDRGEGVSPVGKIQYVEYHPKHVVKIRSGWNDFSDEKHYGKIEVKPGNSPFLK